MIANDLPDRFRRRLGPDDALEEIRRESFARLRDYESAVLRASSGEPVGAAELLDLAASVGRSPARLDLDLQIARAAWQAWKNCIDPV